MSSILQHLPGQTRYVFQSDGVDVGLTDYRLIGHDIHITHTEIDPALRGGGLGAEMVQAVLDTIRSSTDHRVVAECPFVVAWLRHHPDYQDLEERR